MTSLEAGRAQLLAAMPTLPAETVPLEQAGGRILAETITAPIDLPPFDNSSMDGYAVRAEEAATGARLKVVGHAAAGHPFTGTVTAGGAVRLFTGSPLPDGANAVVMQEDVSVSGEGLEIEIRDGVKPWENVRFRGEDVRAGEMIAAAGSRLTPQRLGFLAALGRTSVTVSRKPVVAVLPNGSELVAAGEVPGPGQIYESNSQSLRELLASVGAEVVTLPPPEDEAGKVSAALVEGFRRADVVLTVGGASVGDHDLVRPAFLALGGELDFWKLALKPGKPFFFGKLGGGFLLGLPGNPVSAFVTCVLLVLPALRRLQGETDPAPRTDWARLAEPLANPDRRRHFVRVKTDAEGGVHVSGAQASHLMRSLADADGLVDVPPGETLAAGALVKVIRW